MEIGGFAKCALKKIRFWAINIGNDKKRKTAKLYIIDFYSLLASFVGQNLSLDGQVTSGVEGLCSLIVKCSLGMLLDYVLDWALRLSVLVLRFINIWVNR